MASSIADPTNQRHDTRGRTLALANRLAQSCSRVFDEFLAHFQVPPHHLTSPASPYDRALEAIEFAMRTHGYDVGRLEAVFERLEGTEPPTQSASDSPRSPTHQLLGSVFSTGSELVRLVYGSLPQGRLIAQRVPEGASLHNTIEVVVDEVRARGLATEFLLALRESRPEYEAYIDQAAADLDPPSAASSDGLDPLAVAVTKAREELEVARSQGLPAEELIELQRSLNAAIRTDREGHEPVAGMVLGQGRFHLEAPVGRGGLGTVWLARDVLHPDAPVAVKILRQRHRSDATIKDRFRRGVREQEWLHRQGVRVVPVIRGAQEESGWLYYVLSFFDQGSLADALEESVISPRQAQRLVVEAALLLDQVHQLGRLHRDVKPSNLMLKYDSDWRVFLADFDLVRVQEHGSAIGSAPVGDFLYAAPEILIKGSDADVRADVYGLGMCLVHSLGGPVERVKQDLDGVVTSLTCGPAMRAVVGRGHLAETRQTPPERAGIR